MLFGAKCPFWWTTSAGKLRMRLTRDQTPEQRPGGVGMNRSGSAITAAATAAAVDRHENFRQEQAGE